MVEAPKSQEPVEPEVEEAEPPEQVDDMDFDNPVTDTIAHAVKEEITRRVDKEISPQKDDPISQFQRQTEQAFQSISDTTLGYLYVIFPG